MADLTESTFTSGNGQFPAHKAITPLLLSRALVNSTTFINALRNRFPRCARNWRT